jgi:hypothetical protein
MVVVQSPHEHLLILLGAQCALPVFEGLLPFRHNRIVSDLLFELATWHAFAKLRIHTDRTLELFQATTKSLTRAMRRFLQDTCEAYMTQELPKETAARGRRTAALAAKGSTRAGKEKASMGQKRKKLNLETYKYHALADYPETIRRYGTTDNYNTQIVSLYYILSTRDDLRRSRVRCNIGK